MGCLSILLQGSAPDGCSLSIQDLYAAATRCAARRRYAVRAASLELNPYAISFKIGLKLLSLSFEIPNEADIHDPINTTI